MERILLSPTQARTVYPAMNPDTSLIKNIHLQEDSILALHQRSGEKPRDEHKVFKNRIAELENENSQLLKVNKDLLKELVQLKSSQPKKRPTLDLPQVSTAYNLTF